MDLICLHCGSPWDADHVRHEEPDAFERRGGRITHCPACRELGPVRDPELAARLEAAGAVADLLGDDVDGYESFLEDMGLT